MTAERRVPLTHLQAMADRHGLFEHARGRLPRPEHGYCTDDNARLALVMLGEHSDDAARLGELGLSFVLRAQDPAGRFHNRMDLRGRWTDRPGIGDWWGRALQALGAVAARHPDPRVQVLAQGGFDRGLQQRSRHLRSTVFASLGAAAVLTADRAHRGARELLLDLTAAIGPLGPAHWRWPEPRLAYANATIAEALIAAGAALASPRDVERGLVMLRWLLDRETTTKHLSVVGVGGADPTDPRPQFDQQPIEVAAMAEACWRAFEVTGDGEWRLGVTAAADWFAGRNDQGRRMYDGFTGGGFDGLERTGVNTNQGAESTLALIATMQRTRTLVSSA